MKRGRKLGERSLQILKKIGEFGTEFVVVMTTLPPGYVQVGPVRAVPIYKRVYDLKRRGYVKIKKDKKNQSFLHLTPKGKLQLLKYLHLEKILKRKWDGHWRVVIFDIPEGLKKWRNYLRQDLKNLGFQPLQESVYITPYPVTGDLNELLEEWGLRKYFRYLTVSEIDGEIKLKRKFGFKK